MTDDTFTPLGEVAGAVLDKIDPWAFWRKALAGETPETTPGTPHAGYYVKREYVSLPHSIPTRKGTTAVHRPLCEFPVAIWRDDDGAWHAISHGLLGSRVIEKHDEIDELFARVCRQPITYERFNEMAAKLKEWAA